MIIYSIQALMLFYRRAKTVLVYPGRTSGVLGLLN
jgi:hypothetical protein